VRRHSVPVSRQTFLKGMAGMVVAAGTRNLWTGKTIQPDLYGYATGALLDNDFQLAANKVVESSAETLSPALIRFNTPVQTIIQSVFAAGTAQPDWGLFSRWPQSFTVSGVWLLIVLLPGFGVCCLSGLWRVSCGGARSARVRTGSDCAGLCLLSCC
jgi:hypothetical protein